MVFIRSLLKSEDTLTSFSRIGSTMVRTDYQLRRIHVHKELRLLLNRHRNLSSRVVISGRAIQFIPVDSLIGVESLTFISATKSHTTLGLLFVSQPCQACAVCLLLQLTPTAPVLRVKHRTSSQYSSPLARNLRVGLESLTNDHTQSYMRSEFSFAWVPAAFKAFTSHG